MTKMHDRNGFLQTFKKRSLALRNIEEVHMLIEHVTHRAHLDEQMQRLVRAASREIWTENYHNYLRSAKWRRKRDAVMKRDLAVCRYCGRPATEVHHLTYDRIYDEELEDLAAVCDICHTLLTEYGG